MTTLKLAAALAVVTLAAAGARADDKADVAKKIVGTWQVSKADPGTFPPGAVIEFQTGGKVHVTAKKGDVEVSFDGTYKLDGKGLTLTLMVDGKERTNELTVVKVADGEMTIEGKDGKKVEFSKKK